MKEISKKNIYEYLKLCETKGYGKNKAYKMMFDEEFDKDKDKHIKELDKLWEITKRIDFINTFDWEKACQRTIFETIPIKIFLMKDLMIRFVLSNDTNATKLSGEICKMMSLYQDNSEIVKALDTINISFKDFVEK